VTCSWFRLPWKLTAGSEDKYRQNYPEQDIVYCDSVEDAACESDALLILTDWDEFRHLPWSQFGEKMKSKIIIDTRNMLDRSDLINSGFTYSGIGR